MILITSFKGAANDADRVVVGFLAPARKRVGDRREFRISGLLKITLADLRLWPMRLAFCSDDFWQHETDHLNGKLYISHISALKRDFMKRKIRKLMKAGEW